MVQRVAAVRRDFLTNAPRSTHTVRSTIRESWQRCAPLIDAGRDSVPVVVATDDQLRDLHLNNEPFLTAASTVINRLTGLLTGSGYIIGLADAQGRLLRVSGDENALRWMERIGLAPGGDWSEAAAGTNGIGTALAVGRAVQVVGPEHLCDGWQDITCITVPIRYPWGDKITGVLDISGDYHLVRPFFTGILTAAALEIKENLKDLLTPRQRWAAPFQIAVPKGTPPRAAETAQPGRRLLALQADLQAQLNLQEQRAFAAERLAIAAGMVSASLDIEATLNQVAEQAAHLIDLDSAAVCLFDETGRLTILRAWYKSGAHTMDVFGVLKVLEAQTDVIRHLKESSEPVAINDVRCAARLPGEDIRQRGILAFALLPLLGAHGTDGLILAPRPAPYQWQPDDLRLELTFAFHAATAIENARLFQAQQQHQRHVETLNAVNQLLFTLFDPAQQLELIIDRIVDMMGFDGGLILLQRPDHPEPYLAAHAGLPEATLPDLWQLAHEYVSTGQSSSFCRLKWQANPLADRLRHISLCDIMIAPLAAGGDVLGLLIVGSQHHCDLTGEDLTLFTNIGRQLGLALKNAQLLRSAGENQALREADRIKSRFLMMVSHDLRSPLTAIRTSVESLLDHNGEQSAEMHEQLLRNIAGQAKRLGGLVDRLLDLTRIEARALTLDRDWTELRALIADTIFKFERLNAPCQVKQRLDSDLPLVYVDPERMVQVLWNLLENAHKYSSPGEPVTVGAFSQGEEVFIHVADRGPGIPAEEHEKIFQYFYRLSREQQLHTPGSGLGLAICRGIVDAHGGRIWVEDRQGGGSVFIVALPPSITDANDLISLDDLDPLGLSRN
ncbi:MAG: ATP-binding protein [Anaerolineaceae bacterium]|nr:ATP-binding protein [Anaerolineaceae bacterium]